MNTSTRANEPAPGPTPLPLAGSSDGSAGRTIMRYAVRGTVLVLLVSILVFFVNLRPGVWQELRSFRLGFVPLLVLLVTVAWVANSVRTWLLARVFGHHLKLREALGVTLSTEFANAALPGGIGGVTARVMLQRRLGIRAHETTSMIAADVVADLVYFGVLAIFAGVQTVTLFRRAHVVEQFEESAGVAGVAVAVLVVAVAGAVYLWQRRRRRQPSRRGSWRRYVRRTRLSLYRIWRHGWSLFLASLGAAAVQWTCRYSVLPLTIVAFGYGVEFLPLMLLQGTLLLLAVVVVLPGGGGSVELLSALILPLLVPTSIIGLTIIIWRILTYHLYVAVGGTALWLQTRNASTVRP